MNAATLSPDAPIVRSCDLSSRNPPARGTKVANGVGGLGLYAGCTGAGSHLVAWPHPANDVPGDGLAERFARLCERLDTPRPSLNYLDTAGRGAWLLRRAEAMLVQRAERKQRTFEELVTTGVLVQAPDLEVSKDSKRRGTLAYRVAAPWIPVLRRMRKEVN